MPSEEIRAQIARALEALGGDPGKTPLYGLQVIKDRDWDHEVWVWEEVELGRVPGFVDTWHVESALELHAFVPVDWVWRS